MLISTAYAAAEGAEQAPGMGEAFMLNMMLIVVLIAVFYILVIRPQQKRFKEHQDMLGGLQKGDKVITAGGFIGTIDKIEEGNDEVVLKLGDNVKVTALRSTIQSRKKDKEKETT